LGIETDKVLSHGHQSLPTYGVGKDLSRVKWQAVFRQMMGHDLVRPDPNRHGALQIMESALDILSDKKNITLRMDTIKTAKSNHSIKMLVSEEDAPLLSALKAKRRGLAETAGVPAYIIFNDKTLVEMAQKRPINLDEMAHINGVGAKKLENFGDLFLEVINGEFEKLHPSRRKLAGNKEGILFDLLLEAQNKLLRGEKGLDKPLSCSASLLVKVARRKPRSTQEISQILGDRRTERFGITFLDILNQVD
jgi:ATP-dependent DNA helicase RecQ